MDDASRIYPFRRNLVLAASAGTGKTHSLVGVLLHVLLGASEMGGAPRGPVDPGRIVATTFSRKAAAEIRARVVEELERLASADAASKYRADLDAAGDRAGRPRWSDAELARRARDALAGMGRARIGTLHGFASSILRTYALERGLSPSFELVDEETSRSRVEEAIARAVERFEASDPAPLAELVAAAGGVEALVRQLSRALARLEEDGRGADALEVHDGDVRAMDARMGALLDHAHSLASSPRFADAARRLLSAWSARDVPALVAAAEDFCGVRPGSRDGPHAADWFAFRDDVLEGATTRDRGKNLVARWRLRERFAPAARFARALLAACEDEVRRAVDRSSSFAYGDLLRAARDLLRDRPDLVAEIGASLDVLLVDEVQDTSRLQRDTLLLLWQQGPELRRPGALPRVGDVRQGGLLVVGDRKQSIYSFRGADVTVFAELCVGLAGAPARRALGIEPGRTWEPEVPLADFVPLQHNRRGEPELLVMANELSAERFRPGEPPELYEIAYVPPTEDLLPPPGRMLPSDPVPRTTWLRVGARDRAYLSSPADEAGAIASRIQAIVERGEPRVRAEAPRWRDVAVLAETNRMLDHTAYALACAGIPYVVAGSGFYNAREVRDLVAMLALLLDPSEAWALLEVLRGPWGGVRDETLLALTDRHGGLAPVGPAWDHGPRRAAIHPADRASLERVREVVLALHRDLDRLGPAAALREAVRALDLEEVLVQLPRGAQRVANVRKLLALASRDRDARVLLERLEDAAEREVAEGEAATFSEEDDAVRLLTVHASKGLDFPIVFVPEVGKEARRPEVEGFRLVFGGGDELPALVARIVDEEGFVHAPPSYDRAGDDLRRRARAERQRLAYVAATRASHAMYFVGDRTVPQSGPTDVFLSTTAGALHAIAEDADRRARAMLLVEEIDPAAAPPLAAAPRRIDEGSEREPWVPVDRPVWRSLAVATTAIEDFHHCARRFQLVHLLQLPEPLPSTSVATSDAGRDRARPRADAPFVDARAEGTLAHQVLEQVDVASFGATLLARAEGTRVLERAGIERSDPRHARVLERVLRFLGGAYAARVAAEKGDVAREVPFVLDLTDSEGRTVTLRGAIDLLVRWRDGSADVIDYKRPRGGSVAPHAFQLDAYTLAARSIAPTPTRVRAGIVFLGRGGGEPIWRGAPDAEASVRARLASLGAVLVEARWSERFVRAPVSTCLAIRCGYLARCHPSTSAPDPFTPNEDAVGGG